MKRFYWYAIIDVIGLLLITILGSYLDALFPSAHRLIGLALLLAYLGVVYFFISRKRPVILTEEEMQASVPERQDFSPKITRPRWRTLAICIPAILVVIFLLSFTDIGLYQVFKGAPFMETLIKHLQLYGILFQSITFWVIMIALGVFAIISYRRKSHNKYIIDGDTLIIQENLLFKTEEEIRIPLDTINEVYLSYRGIRDIRLYLNIQGIKRSLNSGTDSLTLGKAILQHKRRFA